MDQARGLANELVVIYLVPQKVHLQVSALASYLEQRGPISQIDGGGTQPSKTQDFHIVLVPENVVDD